MLASGGNAVDAAVAALFALSVVEPMMVSPFGAGFFLIRDGRSGDVVCIDDDASVPAAASPTMYDALPGSLDDETVLAGWHSAFRAQAENHEIVHSRHPEHDANEWGHQPPLLVMDDARRIQTDDFPARLQLTLPGRQHIPDPVGISPIRKGDHVAAALREDVDGGSIRSARTAAAVDDYPECARAGNEDPGDPIGNVAIETG